MVGCVGGEIAAMLEQTRCYLDSRGPAYADHAYSGGTDRGCYGCDGVFRVHLSAILNCEC